jgi:hypothetical protein
MCLKLSIFRTEEFLLLIHVHVAVNNCFKPILLKNYYPTTLFFAHMYLGVVPTNFVQNSFIKCTQGTQRAKICKKNISFKNLLQNQKWCRKTEYSFGKLTRSFISFVDDIFLQLILLL